MKATKNAHHHGPAARVRKTPRDASSELKAALEASGRQLVVAPERIPEQYPIERRWREKPLSGRKAKYYEGQSSEREADQTAVHHSQSLREGKRKAESASGKPVVRAVGSPKPRPRVAKKTDKVTVSGPFPINLKPKFIEKIARAIARERRLNPYYANSPGLNSYIFEVLEDGTVSSIVYGRPVTYDIKNKKTKDEGPLNKWLEKYFEEINLPRSLWTSAAAEIVRVVRKQVVAATERPRWDERDRYPELANLSAPKFLKRVWADQFSADGSIARELVSDKKLLRIVGVYVGNRQSRGLDLGDAEGLRLIRGKTGRPARPSAG
jgi:hypothetical protein